WKALAAACCVASSLAWLTAASAAGRGTDYSAGRPAVSSDLSGPKVRALQFNLCDSGLAACYTGRSVAVAAAVIRQQRPDIVTLNEVCRPDVSELERAMSEAHPGESVTSAFMP